MSGEANPLGGPTADSSRVRTASAGDQVPFRTPANWPTSTGRLKNSPQLGAVFLCALGEELEALKFLAYPLVPEEREDQDSHSGGEDAANFIGEIVGANIKSSPGLDEN